MSGLYNIPLSAPFLGCLADHLLKRYGVDNPRQLHDVTVFLPSQRAIHHFEETLLHRWQQVSGKSTLILPKLLPITIDSPEALPWALPIQLPVLDETARWLAMADLLQQHAPMPLDAAMRLAKQLLPLVDEWQAYGASTTSLEALHLDDLAAGASRIFTYLRLLDEHWPIYIQNLGYSDRIPAQHQLLRNLATHWQQQQWPHPVYVAGLNNDTPAVQQFCQQILQLPQGHLVFYGHMAATQPIQPCFQASTLLCSLSIPRFTQNTDCHSERSEESQCSTRSFAALMMTDLPVADDVRLTPQPRQALIQQLFLPAEQAVQQWPQANLKAGFQGLAVIKAAHPDEEALRLALLVREHLEDPHKTIAIICQDQGLQARITAQLARWQIIPNASTSKPLTQSPVGTLLQLVTRLLTQSFNATNLLCLLQHPLCRLGLPAVQARQLARAVDVLLLRLHPAPPTMERLKAGFEALNSQQKRYAEQLHIDLDTCAAELETLYHHLHMAQQQLSESVNINAAFGVIVQAAAALAMDEHGTNLLHTAVEYSTVQVLMDAMAYRRKPVSRDSDAFWIPASTGMTISNVIEHLLTLKLPASVTQAHARVHLWGLLESHVQRVDVVLLAGMQAGDMPHIPSSDWLLGSALRRALNLPAQEAAIGQQATLVRQLLACPQVYLSYSTNSNGAPAAASVWIEKLQLLAALNDYPNLYHDTPHLAALCAPPVGTQPVSTAANPPLAARPTTLSVSDLQTLRENPYAYYGSKILGLRPLPAATDSYDARDQGNILHAVLERFCLDYPLALPDDAAHILHQYLQEALAHITTPWLVSFWRQRLRRALNGYLQLERVHRQDFQIHGVERRASAELTLDQGLLASVHAKADRLDIPHSGDNHLMILDYKTGTLPSLKNVKAGIQLQLPMEAWLALQGGFDDLAPDHTSIAYWQLQGSRKKPAQTLALTPDDTAVLMAESVAFVTAMLNGFLVAGASYTPYPAAAFPYTPNRPRDYDHLARVS